MGVGSQEGGKGGCVLSEARSCLPFPEKGRSSAAQEIMAMLAGEGATLAKVSVMGPPLPTQVVRKAIVQAGEWAGMFWPLM